MSESVEKPGPPPIIKISAVDHATQEPPILVALRSILEDRPADSLKALQSLNGTSQDVLLCLLPMAARLGGRGLESMTPADLLSYLQQLQNLEAHLRQRAPLQLTQLCFCKIVEGFGSYQPVLDQPPTYQETREGRQPELVEVYAEIDNFTVEQREGGYVAHLASSLEIQDMKGQVVWTEPCEDKPEVSRSKWRDHFLRFRFRVPKELKPGHYMLCVQVRDVLAKPSRTPARRSLLFRVIAQGSVVGPQTGPATVSQ
jgi:hypothetical protein